MLNVEKAYSRLLKLNLQTNANKENQQVPDLQFFITIIKDEYINIQSAKGHEQNRELVI